MPDPSPVVVFSPLSLGMALAPGHRRCPVNPRNAGAYYINAAIAICAAYIVKFLTGRPVWILIQRWLMGGVLADLAVRIMFEAKK